MKRVVITGMGALAPTGNSVGEVWEALCNGRSGVGRVSRFDPSPFPSRIGGEVKGFDPGVWISTKEAARMDRFAQFAVCAARMAVSDAGLDLGKEDPRRIAILVGSAIGGIQTIEEQHDLMAAKGPRRVSPLFIPMILANMAPGMIAMQLAVKGPAYSVASGCASGAYAIGEAWLKARRRGRSSPRRRGRAR